MWRAQKQVPDATANLDAIRPQLDRIGRALVRQLYFVSSASAMDRTEPAVQLAWIKLQAKYQLPHRAIVSLQQITSKLTAAAPSLAAIRAAGVIRVGVTGDYAPFSWEQMGELRGADVQLALQLADRLGVQAHFVRTTWLSLMDDLRAGRFDIAVGGISITAEREAQATFSKGYFRDGKVPLARCANREQLDTLDEINLPTVRVVVNPGGTNEKFARQHFATAKLTVHKDNRSVFEELISGRQDVMVTDGIEADIQARRHSILCRTRADTFIATDKAVLMPKGFALQQFIDDFISTKMSDGSIRSAMHTAVDAAANAN